MDEFLSNTDSKFFVIRNILLPILEVYEIINNATMDNNENINGSYCASNFKIQPKLDYEVISIAIIFIFILSILVKRISFKTELCHGKPGLPIPMNIMNNHNHNHTFAYTLAFLSLSEDIFQIILGFKSEFNEILPIERFFIKLLLIICFITSSYPIFAAICGKHIIGYIIAAFYSGTFLVHGVVKNIIIASCLNDLKRIPFIIYSVINSSIDLMVLLLIFRRICILFKNKNQNKNEIEDSIREDKLACWKYVQNLLTKYHKTEIQLVHLSYSNVKKYNKIILKIMKKIYIKIPGFQVPPRLIIGLVVGLYFSYRLLLNMIRNFTPSGMNIIIGINKKILTTEIDINTAFKIVSGNNSIYSTTERQNAYRYLTFFYVNLLISCSIASVIIGSINSVFQSFLFLRNYRLQFHQLTKKGFSSIIPIDKAPTPSSLISGFVKYNGYQAAFVLWGVLLVSYVTFLWLFIIIGFFILPLWYIENSRLRKFCYEYIPVLVISFIFNKFQSIIIKYFFVKENGQLMEVDNRKAFMIYTHCAFFLNAIMGSLKAIIRFTIWYTIGVFYFSRIDLCALPNNLQILDSGYISYIGFLYTEQYHHNPILKCFVYLLMESKQQLFLFKDDPTTYVNENNEKFQKTNKYYIKWKIALTLIRNPHLQSFRKKKINF